MTTDTPDLFDDRVLDELSAKAWAIYNSKLKALLEPEHLGKLVAIHLDTEDYEIAQASSKAHFALRARHPGGMISVMDIGPVDPYDSLTLRMLGKQFLAGQKK